MAVETRNSLLVKLGIFGVAAIGLFLVGKRHTAIYKDERHRRETDARIDSEDNEFGVHGHRPGFPSHNPTLNYDGRGSRYEGTGSAYASRQGGDRLSFFSIFKGGFEDRD
ncbi:uncharacterized protein CANTADRAFT_26619 [Suhomyces tanzawaensis NRRL Y-17324]|uniref:Uncharacterized protein n=1 Tax=Suhomyces tanzawaensis NRRL Y-17324 TaxID=984487 RepID=A0A1E4SGN1_9ASCO|nr:uncharacterized protein CANTADRAFT_26619 [Suhomyces tanzawaensis NRRL Y-17324]ODV78572.1 hypothetical protein CANTADRAFT_26619 [Suhomyces tanzawaensis NRRL Y-17324]